MPKTKNKIITSAISLIIFSLLICSVISNRLNPDKKNIQLESPQINVMGTFAQIIAVAENKTTAQSAINAAIEKIKEIDDMMSDYKPDSQLSLLNKNAFNNPVKVSQPLFIVLEKSLRVSNQTDGAFDITVGPLIDLFKSDQKKRYAPTEKEIAEAKGKIGYQKLILNKTNHTASFAVEGMRLDLGAIAKGYAADLAAKTMQNTGAAGGLVDIGGDICCFGSPPPNRTNWYIGLQNPKNVSINSKPLLTLKLNDCAVVTSGNYQRFYLIKNKKFSHIVNPRNGKSASELSSVTIITKNCAQADALATAVSVMGRQKGFDLIKNTPNTEAILIVDDPNSPTVKNILKTDGIKQFLKDD